VPGGHELRIVELPGAVHGGQRIVAQRAHGEDFRSRFIRIIDHHRSDLRVDAISIVYKSKDGFIGTDRMTLDVNYRDGNVIRYVYTINVR
jgi:hypothetical protein